MTHLDMIARNGVPFRAVINDEDGTVAFYDRRHPHTEHGQFTGGRYFISTLLDEDVYGPGPAGLNLYGGVDDWSLDAKTYALVLDWLRTRVETADLWDALHDKTDLPGIVGLARREGASWSFISHATQRTGDNVRRMYREETSR